MARSVTSKTLQTRSARLKLAPRHQPYWVLIAEGLSLGYRRAANNSGKWQARLYVGQKKYRFKALQKADDYEDSNRATVLTFFEAQDAARKLAREAALREHPGLSQASLKGAADDYMVWFRDNRKSISETEYIINGNILPPLGRILLQDLTSRKIRSWMSNLAKRVRPATVNRNLQTLKAILNFAWREGMIEDDKEWRRVKKLRVTDVAKIRFLSVEESTLLINSCASGFRQLVRAALLTGARYGELTRLTVGDYDVGSATIFISESKSGKTRHIPLSAEGSDLFDEMTAGRARDDRLFLRENGTPWGRYHQKKPLKVANERASIDPPATFHMLRHTYASLLAQEGVSLQVISEALGHSETRITEQHYAHLQPSYVAETIRASLPRFEGRKSNVRRLRRNK